MNADERPGPAKGHVLITGTGRSGTTLLMRILTRAGLDTGFTSDDIDRVDNNVGRAGLEKPVRRRIASQLLEFIKRPDIDTALENGLTEGWLRLDLAIVPMRNLEDAAASRIAVHERAISSDLNPKRAPGGLWLTDEPDQQKNALAVHFYTLVHRLVRFGVPILFVDFPRFAKDKSYFRDKFGGLLLGRCGLQDAELMAAYAMECKPEYIEERKQVSVTKV